MAATAITSHERIFPSPAQVEHRLDEARHASRAQGPTGRRRRLPRRPRRLPGGPRYLLPALTAPSRPEPSRRGTWHPTDIVILQDATFEQEVLKSDVPVLVDFWAVWCGPCKAIAPTVEELAKQYKGKVKVAKMDVDEHQNVPQQYGIRSIPTLLLFKGGRVVDTIVGAVPKAKLEESLQEGILTYRRLQAEGQRAAARRPARQALAKTRQP